MTKEMTKEECIVKAILTDLTDRSGLGDEFEACDLGTQEEIEQTWLHICTIVLEQRFPEASPQHIAKEAARLTRVIDGS